MRLVHTILLSIIPAGALGAHTIQQVAPALAPAAAPDEAVTVRGDRARAEAIESALSDLDAEILLGEARCDEAVTASSQRTARYAAGSRRYDNPDYITLSAEKSELDAALSALTAEEAALRGALSIQAERESLQLGRAEQAARDLRDTERALSGARDELSTTRGRLSRARSAADAIATHAQQQRTLAAEIQTLRADIDALKAQLAAAPAAPDPRAAAEAQLSAATAAAERADAAMRAAREDPTLGDEARRALRDAARAARAALVAAESAVLAAQPAPAPTPDRHLDRRLRRQEDALAAAESARAALRAPGASDHELASRLPRLEQRQLRQSAQVTEIEQDAAQRRQRVAVEEVRATELARQRAEQEAALSALMAAEEEQRAAILRVEASLASVPRSRSRTRWEEARYTVETIERTCQVTATAIWPDGSFTQLTAAARDTDDAHPSVDDARISADPLDYDRTDAERIRDADRDLVAQLRAATRSALASAGDTGR